MQLSVTVNRLLTPAHLFLVFDSIRSARADGTASVPGAAQAGLRRAVAGPGGGGSGGQWRVSLRRAVLVAGPGAPATAGC